MAVCLEEPGRTISIRVHLASKATMQKSVLINVGVSADQMLKHAHTISRELIWIDASPVIDGFDALQSIS